MTEMRKWLNLSEISFDSSAKSDFKDDHSEDSVLGNDEDEDDVEEGVSKQGVSDVSMQTHGKSPTDRGTGNFDSILSNDEEDEEEGNLIKEKIDIRKELISIFKKFNAAERLEHQAHMRGDNRRSKIKSKEMHDLNKKFWFILRKNGVDVPKPKDRDIGLYGNLTTSPSDFVDTWLNESDKEGNLIKELNAMFTEYDSSISSAGGDGDASQTTSSISRSGALKASRKKKFVDDEIEETVTQYSDSPEGVKNFAGVEGYELTDSAHYVPDPWVPGVWLVMDKDYPSGLGGFAAIVSLPGANDLDGYVDEKDYEEAMEDYGHHTKESFNEAEPVRSKKDIALLRKLGYSEERIGRMDVAEANHILYLRLKANKMGESIEKKERAFWTELDEKLFTKASMTLGKAFLPKDDEDDEEDIDEDHDDQYNVNAWPATPGHETWVENRYEDVIFLQGEEAEEVIHIINQKGPDDGLEHLTQWHYPGEHQTRDKKSHGTSDNVYYDNGYTMFWNNGIPYAGLIYDTTTNEAKRSKSLGYTAPVTGAIPIKRKK